MADTERRDCLKYSGLDNRPNFEVRAKNGRLIKVKIEEITDFSGDPRSRPTYEPRSCVINGAAESFAQAIEQGSRARIDNFSEECSACGLEITGKLTSGRKLNT